MATGKTKWIAEAASTFYNTAVMGRLADGTPAVLHGRGGPHDVPERPVGLTMTSLAPGNEGKSLWTYEGSGTALYTMTWDEKYAYWFTTAPNESHVVLDASDRQGGAHAVALSNRRRAHVGRQQTRAAGRGEHSQHHRSHLRRQQDARHAQLAHQHRRRRVPLVPHLDQQQPQRRSRRPQRPAPLRRPRERRDRQGRIPRAPGGSGTRPRRAREASSTASR